MPHCHQLPYQISWDFLIFLHHLHKLELFEGSSHFLRIQFGIHFGSSMLLFHNSELRISAHLGPANVGTSTRECRANWSSLVCCTWRASEWNKGASSWTDGNQRAASVVPSEADGPDTPWIRSNWIHRGHPNRAADRAGSIVGLTGRGSGWPARSWSGQWGRWSPDRVWQVTSLAALSQAFLISMTWRGWCCTPHRKAPKLQNPQLDGIRLYQRSLGQRIQGGNL